MIGNGWMDGFSAFGMKGWEWMDGNGWDWMDGWMDGTNNKTIIVDNINRLM